MLANSETGTGIWNPRERKYWMVIFFVFSILLYASRNILAFCAPAITTELSWSMKDRGLVLSIFYWGYICTQFLGGFLSDQWGGKLVILMSALIWGLITAAYVVLPISLVSSGVNFFFFLLLRFLLGISQGFFYPSLASLMATHVQTGHRQFTYAFLTSGTHAGTLIAGLLGSSLTNTFTWRFAFFLIGSFTFAWVAIIFYSFDINPRSPLKMPTALLSASTFDRVIQLREADVQEEPCIGDDEEPLLTQVCTSANLDWRTLLRRPAFWSMLLANFSLNNGFFIILNWLPSYLKETYHSSNDWLLNVIPYLLVFPFTLLGGILADYLITRGVSVTYVRKILATITLMGTSFFLFVANRSNGFMPSLTSFSLFLGCCGFHNSGILLNPQDIAPLHGGIMSTVGTIPGITGVYLTGYILQSYHSWTAVFNFIITLNILSWLAYCIFGTGLPLV